MKQTLKIEGYDNLFSKEDLLNTIEGQKILEKVRNNELSFNCLCLGKDNPLRMWPRRVPRGRYYHFTIVRANGTKDKHHPDCTNYSITKDNTLLEEDSGNEYEINKEDKVDEDKKKEEVDLFDDEIYVNKKVITKFKNGLLEPLVFVGDFHLKKELKIPDNNVVEIKNQKKRSYMYSQMFSVGENILFYSWYNYIKTIGENPNIEKLFKAIYEGKEKHIITKDGISTSINDVIFKPFGKQRYNDINGIIKKAHAKIYYQSEQLFNMFVFGKLINYKPYDKNKDYLILTIEEPQKNNYYNLLIEEKSFTNRYRKSPTKADKLICCFVKSSLEPFLEIESFAFIPVVPKLGVSVDSNYEVEFAMHLVNRSNEILFVKPPKSSNPYRDIFGKSNNPDFILFDKDLREEATIVEVFGYDKKLVDNVDFINKYWEKANKKIEFYKSLKNYNFLYWLAYKYDLPKVYQPKKTIKEE